MKTWIVCGLLTLPSAAFAQTDKKGSESFSSKSHQAMATMDQKMTDMKMTGDVSTDFAAMMIPHHQGAVDMAKAYLESGKDPELRAMAEKMVSDQEKEIKELQAWLERKGKKTSQSH